MKQPFLIVVGLLQGVTSLCVSVQKVLQELWVVFLVEFKGESMMSNWYMHSTQIMGVS